MEPGLSSSLFRKRSPDSLRPDQTSIFSIPSPTRCRARSFDALRMTKKSERPPLPPLTCSNRDEVPHLHFSLFTGCRGHPCLPPLRARLLRRVLVVQNAL